MTQATPFDINSEFKGFKQPCYDIHPMYVSFSNEVQFQQWFDSEPKQHGNWLTKDTTTSEGKNAVDVVNRRVLICNHAGKGRVHKPSNPEEDQESRTVKKRRVLKPSIKCNCTARIIVKTLLNQSMLVTYTWKHVNHNPSDPTEAIRERLDPEILQWIFNHVENGKMDWKSIKNVLRLNEDNLDVVSDKKMNENLRIIHKSR